MATDNRSPLDRVLVSMHPRRAVAALAAGLASMVLLRTADVDPGPDAVARRRRKAEVQGPCGDGKGKDNKCRKNRDCCTLYCDQSTQRCRYVEVGEQCTSDQQCRGTGTCVDSVCARGASTPTPSPTPTTPGEWSHTINFGSYGTGEGATDFNYPSKIAVSTDELTAWVADTDNSRISVWTREASSATVWTHSTNFGSEGTGNDNFSLPNDVAVSADGRTAWVADSDNNRISIWTRSGSSTTDWTYSTAFTNPDLSYPSGVAVSLDTLTAWVSDSTRISVWTRETNTSTNWTQLTYFGTGGSEPSQFQGLESLRVTADGLTVFGADSGNHRISVWTRETSSNNFSHSTNFGTYGFGDSNLRNPYGLAVSADGLIAWVADRNNQRISIWTRTDGTSTDWTHSGNFGSGTDGSGDTEFSWPRGVAVSANGLTAWVADTNNSRISIWNYGWS